MIRIARIYGTLLKCRLAAALALTLVTASLATAEESLAESDNERACISESGRYRLSFASDLEPIAINRIHRWVLRIETDRGEPVTGAEVGIDGGMPEHDHGLPTRPRPTEELGGGDYLIEGLRFHMNGEWEIVVAVRSGNARDTCTFSLNL
jgi:hypothetical protein